MTFKINDVHALLNKGIERVNDSNWKNFIRHIIKEEDNMWNIDNIMDEIIDNLESCTLTITGETTSCDSE